MGADNIYDFTEREKQILIESRDEWKAKADHYKKEYEAAQWKGIARTLAPVVVVFVGLLVAFLGYDAVSHWASRVDCPTAVNTSSAVWMDATTGHLILNPSKVPLECFAPVDMSGIYQREDYFHLGSTAALRTRARDDVPSEQSQ